MKSVDLGRAERLHGVLKYTQAGSVSAMLFHVSFDVTGGHITPLVTLAGVFEDRPDHPAIASERQRFEMPLKGYFFFLPD